MQVVNWTNPNLSATNKPTSPLYVGVTGFTPNIADAVNIKGSQGLQGLQGIQGANGLNGANGTNGWSPVITLRKDTLTNLVYFYLGSWVGGTGVSPTTIGYISNEGVTPSPVAGSDIGSLPMTVPISFLSASGSPEGVVTASIPTIYIDSINGNIYTKTTNATNTDWKLVTLT